MGKRRENVEEKNVEQQHIRRIKDLLPFLCEVDLLERTQCLPKLDEI